MAEHERVECGQCGRVIRSCRCMGPHKVRYAVCAACERKDAGKVIHSESYAVFSVGEALKALGRAMGWDRA